MPSIQSVLFENEILSFSSRDAIPHAIAMPIPALRGMALIPTRSRSSRRL
jgi:hypothetical protein